MRDSVKTILDIWEVTAFFQKGFAGLRNPLLAISHIFDVTNRSQCWFTILNVYYLKLFLQRLNWQVKTVDLVSLQLSLSNLYTLLYARDGPRMQHFDLVHLSILLACLPLLCYILFKWRLGINFDCKHLHSEKFIYNLWNNEMWQWWINSFLSA